MKNQITELKETEKEIFERENPTKDFEAEMYIKTLHEQNEYTVYEAMNIMNGLRIEGVLSA